MKPTKVFVCPLSWGLGHATRCIPIVEALQKLGAEVILSGNGASGVLLQKRFPELPFLELPFHEVKLHGHLPAWLSVTYQLPRLMYDLLLEKKVAHKVASEYNVDIIISDNRYMLHSTAVTSVLITHQLHIMLPFLFKPIEPLLTLIVRALASPFQQIWVPDFKGKESISGALSHGWLCRKKGVSYIGPLTRFRQPLPPNRTEPGKVVAIISGPEPSRSTIQKELARQAAANDILLTMICGNPQSSMVEKNGSVTLFSHLPDDELVKELASAEVIITSAGYSTVMDLWALNCHAVLLPFPGQTEQRYLARYLTARGAHLGMTMTNFNLKDAITHFSNAQFKKRGKCPIDIHSTVANLLEKKKDGNHGS